MRLLYSLLALAALFSSCQSKETPTDYKIDGAWAQDGYGQYLKIVGDSAFVYNYTSHSCDPLESDLLEELLQVIEVGADDLLVKKGINHYTFKRLDALPDFCSQDNAIDRNDPVHNFESVWHTFDQHYAYFGEREIDWQKSYDKYRARVDSSTSDVELFVVLNDMLEEIGDGHVGLEPSDEVMEQLVALEEEKEDSSSTDEPAQPSVHSIRQQLKSDITDRYLASTSHYNSGVVRWGMMQDDVAYVQLNWMLLLADVDLPDTLDLAEFWGAYWALAEEGDYHRDAEAEGAVMIVDSIVRELSHAKAFIIDIRFNGGGKDDAALAFLQPFVDATNKAFTKKAQLENGYTTPQEISLTKAAHSFDGPVYLLTSPQTASAAEIMTLASMSSAQVTRIGSATEGIFSDMLDRVMPNGWTYSLSNEVYQDLDLNNYENKGISPHHELGYPRDSRAMYELLAKDIKNGDKAIEMALRLAKSIH